MKPLLLFVCGSAMAMTYSETEPFQTLAEFPLQLEISRLPANTYSLTDARFRRLTLSVMAPEPDYGIPLPQETFTESSGRWIHRLDAPGPGYRQQQSGGAR